MSNEKTVFCLVFAACAGVFAGDISEGLEFMLDFRSDSGQITSMSVGNALNASGALAPAATLHGGASEENKVRQQVGDCTPPLYPWQTKTVRMLNFPQCTATFETEGGPVKKVDPVAVSFSNSAQTSARQTTYVRFRWGGPLDTVNYYVGWMVLNGYDWNASGADGSKGVGWGIGVRYNKDSSPATGHLVLMVPPETLLCDWAGAITLDEGVWYDMFVDIEPKPEDPAIARITVSVLKPTEGKTVDGEYVYTIPALQSIVADKQFKTPTYTGGFSSLRLGTELNSAGYKSITENSGGYSKSFRGDIARVMTWSRILDQEEKFQVMSEGCGFTFGLGLENGSADEFAATPSGGNVWTNGKSWAAVARSLTEENPSLVICDEIPAREEHLGKILHVKPVGSSGPLPVEVSVNGAAVGTFDLATAAGRAVYIPGEMWVNGESGKAKIEIRRIAPFDKPLELDAVTLGGGWKMNGALTREGYVRSRHYIGQRDPKTVQRATIMSPWSKYPSVEFSYRIGADALERFRHYFTAKVRGGSVDIPQAFLVNGRKFAEFGTSPAGAVQTVEVPPGFLVPGENVFSVSNMVPSSASSKWVRYSDYAIEVKPHKGFMLIVK